MFTLAMWKRLLSYPKNHIDHSIRVELDLDEFEETPSELRKKSHLQGD